MTYSHELEELSLRARLAGLCESSPQIRSLADDFIADDASEKATSERAPSLFRLVITHLVEEARSTLRARSLRRRLRRLDVDRKSARKAARLCQRIALISRRSIVVPRARVFLKAWKRIHVPFSILMAVTTVAHIVIAIEYSM
jgi:hypothetical protein